MKKLLIIVLLLISYNAIADSYDDSLKELFELTDVRGNYLNLNNLIINQMQAGFFQAADQNIDATSMSEEQKKQVGEILKSRFTEMVKGYENHIKEAMPYEKVQEEVFIPLYKDSYTESEVKELIAFYKTPVGKKSVEISQKISQQATQKTAEKYDSAISDYVTKQIDENIELVKKEIKEKEIE
ncbi:MAG: DUF2059 domain-containing protein [Gammaproteobacteria bacterium]